MDLVIRGGRRAYGDKEKRLRLPLTEDILHQILPQVPNDHNGINLRAAICVAFAGFLRSGEFTWEVWNATSHHRQLSRGHIQLKATSMSLKLPSSKTDPFASGVDIHLAASPGSVLCPVAATQRLFALCPGSPQEPAFTRTAGPFNKAHLIASIRKLLLQAGIPTHGFSGHSLRKGAAVTAARKGIPKDEIKLLGRWKSDAVDVYINEVPEATRRENLLQLNARLLNQVPKHASLGATNLPPPPNSSSLPTVRRLARRDLQRSARGRA